MSLSRSPESQVPVAEDAATDVVHRRRRNQAHIIFLLLALSRVREAEADLDAAELTGDPAGLASALVKLRQWQESRLRQLLPTGRILRLPTLLTEHPPTEERIRRLNHLAETG